jgi:iron complex outermembrane recepter protein
MYYLPGCKKARKPYALSAMKTAFTPLAASVLLIIAGSLDAHGQKPSSTLQGQILAADGTPAVNVTVELKKSGRMSTSDNQGFFSFRHLPARRDTLLISAVDSKLYSCEVLLVANATTNLGTIHLEFKIRQLQYLEVIGRADRSYKSDYSFFGTKTQTPIIDIPQSISTVTKELIQDKMELTLKDAVNDVSGVNQYSGFDEYTIRGFRAENSRDINGLRGYNMIYSSPMLVNIERIEVVKGPSATLYGNCDAGGTINLVTKKPLTNLQAEVDLYLGTWDHGRAQADVTGPLNTTKTLLYRFNLGVDNSNSFRHGQYSGSYELAPSLTFIPNDKLQINLDFSLSQMATVLDWGQPGYEKNDNLKLTPISLSPSQPGDYLRESDAATIVSLSYKFNKHLSFSSGYLNYLTRQYVASHAVQGYITPDSTDLLYTTWTYPTWTNTFSNYFTYACGTARASNELVFGYDYIVSRVNLNQQYFELPSQFAVGSGTVGTFSLRNPEWVAPPIASYQVSTYNADGTSVNDNIYHTQGVYAQDAFGLGRWKLLVGLREEFYKADQTDIAGELSEQVFLPRIGLVYALKSNISLYATYNKGFDGFEASSSTQIFHAPFKPQISYLYEAGAKGLFFHKKLSASLSVYQLTVLNVPVSANILSDPNLYVQQGQNRSRGMELEAAGNILPNLSLTLSYAYCNALVTQSKVPSQVGTRVENAPLNSGGSWIKYTFSQGRIKDFGLSVGCTGVGQRSTLDPSITLPGYFILSGGLHYSHKHYLFALNANNLTNQTYWMGAYNSVNKWPGAPRNLMLHLGYRF